ncbi:Crp/Fnr family transcriptional regulator [Penaeicola halotolerans]|uniref:Crp/Fnr family transcriptional regulator n=1 Tax=Penaeicola halotolerans TaxID=2793196 RepID=UPI001CF8C32B|nr:Crp/Fnr family transcriptional regulator [Penaeicola halotolerans]
MEKTELSQILKANFKHLENDLRDEIVQFGKLESIPAGDLLMDMGSPITYVPLIFEGNIKVTREDEEGNEIFLYYLESGDSCALSLICSGRERISRIRAVATEDVVAIMIPIAKMDEWMVKYKTWYYFVLETYQYRLEELLRTIDSIAFKKMDDRIVEYLRKTSETQNSLTLHATHQSIAQELNSSREVISRLLKKLEQKGMIKLGRNQIEIIDLFL